MTLIYTDSPQEVFGFLDIINPANPVASGFLALPFEPTRHLSPDKTRGRSKERPFFDCRSS
ncbi:MAG: hypothetical protein Rhims3KO_02660 [Hyphomicrobiales bacterium]